MNSVMNAYLPSLITTAERLIREPPIRFVRSSTLFASIKALQDLSPVATDRNTACTEVEVGSRSAKPRSGPTHKRKGAEKSRPLVIN